MALKHQNHPKNNMSIKVLIRQKELNSYKEK
jgi:hypothetical protein